MLRSRRKEGLAARLLGPFFILAGTLHFVKPETYQSIMPPFVPRPREAVAVSGAAEIAGGVAAMPASTRRVARWWLIAVLIGVFPANVHMAVNPDQVPGPDIPRWLMWLRLPVQGLFMAWVWRATE